MNASPVPPKVAEETAEAGGAPAPGRPRRWLRFAPLLAIAVGLGLVFALGLDKYLSLDALRAHHEALAAFVARNFWGALALFMLAYALVVALSLPGGAMMSVAAGFLFGIWTGTAVVVVAATLGASAIFIAARTAFGEFLRARAAGFVRRIEDGFSRNAFSYLLLLRLIPLFPFFVVNIAPAFTRIKTREYVLATFIGIIPGSFAYVSAGNGLGAILARGGEVAFGRLLLQPEILTPIVALSVLALLPVLWRVLRRRDKLDAEQQ
ncbi:TVP38/TMEM64 family protein [Amphiplicatus metriothermophilus]|uniref:TVP38/TMEM64 family membrane protein n=1 Tax=Amphiplicatus metriothermophilus TaxID=1519374 RepID=A0A239PKN3_9PROT|nr:VTT domain-containing protein [Amphiplicatus metriothermophilus]MBB5518052.1 putative membrane protein YdjX (TVP38/TMEM64 family) [Amphiplicatus metriothermophilus]SNT67614.1 Uncharacterized membrane protein YdjX, TVP38/TMEM64 family, SNARE-associated domain [Amphiplicatus metriothermophilus]